jgi:hypothetical protein
MTARGQQEQKDIDNEYQAAIQNEEDRYIEECNHRISDYAAGMQDHLRRCRENFEDWARLFDNSIHEEVHRMEGNLRRGRRRYRTLVRDRSPSIDYSQRGRSLSPQSPASPVYDPGDSEEEEVAARPISRLTFDSPVASRTRSRDVRSSSEEDKEKEEKELSPEVIARVRLPYCPCAFCLTVNGDTSSVLDNIVDCIDTCNCDGCQHYRELPEELQPLPEELQPLKI